MTFSIVAWDPDSNPATEWGVAVASKFLSVGAVVPWARAGVGAIATQALANVSYGAEGLGRLERGGDAPGVVAGLIGADGLRAHRQLGVVDASGRAESFTGAECLAWAGGIVDEGFCCQGNILAGPEVVEEMAGAFRSADGELAVRLLAALAAGDDAGGDRRGRQSAALLVVREGGAYGGGTDKAVDLRVDDHAEPIPELHRLFDMHRLLFPRPSALRFVDVDDHLAATMRSALGSLGYDSEPVAGYDHSLRAALLSFVGTENLEERWTDEAKVDQGIVDHLLKRANLAANG